MANVSSSLRSLFSLSHIFTLLLICLPGVSESLRISVEKQDKSFIYVSALLPLETPFTCTSANNPINANSAAANASSGRRLAASPPRPSVFGLGLHNADGVTEILTRFDELLPSLAALLTNESDAPSKPKRSTRSSAGDTFTGFEVKKPPLNAASMEGNAVLTGLAQLLFHNNEQPVAHPSYQTSPYSLPQPSLPTPHNTRSFSFSRSRPPPPPPSKNVTQCTEYDPASLGSSGGGQSAAAAQGRAEILACTGIALLTNRLRPNNIAQILCDCIGASSLPRVQCSLISSLTTSIGCMLSHACPVTDPEPFMPDIDAEDPRTMLPLVKTIPTPPVIKPSVVTREQYTYYLLWKAISHLSWEASLVRCGQPTRAKSVPGWENLFTVYLIEQADTPHNLSPFLRIAARARSDGPPIVDYLIIVRPTHTRGEWGLDFSYNQALGSLTAAAEDAPGIHRGFLALASTAFIPIQEVLQSTADMGLLGRVIVTGHSLGGGVSAVLGYLISQTFPPETKAKAASSQLPNRYSSGDTANYAVLFAAPRAGDAGLVAAMNKDLVYRHIVAELDPIPLIPCNVFPGCAGGSVPIATAKDFKTSFNFASYGGRVQFGGATLPPPYSVAGTNLQVVAWHSCAYDCWLSTSVDPKHLASCFAPDNGTLPSQSGASFCAALGRDEQRRAALTEVFRSSFAPPAPPPWHHM